MRSWPLHIVFAIILVGSLVARERAGDVLNESGDLEPAVIRVAQSQGLVFRGSATIADTDVRALKFEAPRCIGALMVTLLDSAFDQDVGGQSARKQGNLLRYVYIDSTWDKPVRLAFFIERTKYAALATFGLTSYLPSWHLLRVESPPQCQIANGIDWRMVWDRNYLANYAKSPPLIGAH